MRARLLISAFAMIGCAPTPSPVATSARPPAAIAPSTSASASTIASAPAPPTPEQPLPPRDPSDELEGQDATDLAPPTWGPGVAYQPKRASALSKPPGPCVDPAKDVKKRSGYSFPITDPIFPAPTLDFDGDGVSDLIFDVGAVDISEEVYLYVLRGSCGHFVGRFFNDHTPSRALTTTTHGLADLEGRRASRHGPARREPTIYRFDGTVYREAETLKDSSLPPSSARKP